MQSAATKLKISQLIQQRSRKHSDSPVFKSPLSAALGLSKNSLPFKQTLKKHEPITPNLQFIKQTKARQTQGSIKKKLSKFSNQPIHQSLDQGDNMQSEQIEPYEIQYVCHSHPNKKGKYFLQSNPNVAFCTKCALSLRQTQSLLDIQKLHKTMQIDKFRTMVTLIQNAVEERQQQKQNIMYALKNQYIMTIEILNNQFQKLFKIIDEKRISLIQQIQNKYQNLQRDIDKQSVKLKDISNAVTRYIQDIDSNYQDHFDQIMQQYHYKIQGHYNKIEEETRAEYHLETLKINLEPIITAVNKINVHKKGFKEDEKQNNNSLNMKNIRGKPRTPNRKPI